MTPLGMIVAGIGLVVLDFRFDGLDLLPDLVGWGVVLAGLSKLADRSPWFTAAAVAAGCGVLVGIPLLVAAPGQVLSSIETIVHGIVVFGTLTGIREVVEDPRTRDTANRIRWIDLSLTLPAVIVTMLIAPTRVTGSGSALVVIYALVTVAVFVWFLVFLWTHRDDPALGSPSSRRQPDLAR